MIATTIEQSKRLIKLGIDATTADMVYSSLHTDYPWVWVGKPLLEIGDIPAWSLSALLDQLPKSIITDEGDEYELTMNKEDDLTYAFGYCSTWNNSNIVEFISQEAVEAAYELLCWLLENTYI